MLLPSRTTVFLAGSSCRPLQDTGGRENGIMDWRNRSLVCVLIRFALEPDLARLRERSLTFHVA